MKKKSFESFTKLCIIGTWTSLYGFLITHCWCVREIVLSICEISAIEFFGDKYLIVIKFTSFVIGYFFQVTQNKPMKKKFV